MNIRTKNGIKIFCLPDNACCTQCGEHPADMFKCPIRNFDYFGDECVPELCDCYTEERDSE